MGSIGASRGDSRARGGAQTRATAAVDDPRVRRAELRPDGAARRQRDGLARARASARDRRASRSRAGGRAPRRHHAGHPLRARRHSRPRRCSRRTRPPSRRRLEFTEGPAERRFANLPAEVMAGAREARSVVVSSANIARSRRWPWSPSPTSFLPPPRSPGAPVEEGPLPAPH